MRTPLNGNAVSNLFSGDSRTVGLDLVWKYAPNGNIKDRYLKMQTEYFRRKERGDLTYDTAVAGADDGDTEATRLTRYNPRTFGFRLLLPQI